MADPAPNGVPLKRGPGRPPKPRPDLERLAKLSAEDLIHSLEEAIKPDVEALRMRALQGTLPPLELRRLAAVARTLDTLARAKRQLIEASKAGDLSGIPAAELARIVVRAMRNDPDLKAAIVAEMKLDVVA